MHHRVCRLSGVQGQDHLDMHNARVNTVNCSSMHGTKYVMEQLRRAQVVKTVNGI